MYRDRASERREGAQAESEAAGDLRVARLSVAETQFLGGDAEHTHLVRGLDVALLQRTRELQTVAATSQRVEVGGTVPAAPPTARTPLGHALLLWATGGGARHKAGAPATRFARHHTTFVFKLEVRPPAPRRTARRSSPLRNQGEAVEELPTTLVQGGAAAVSCYDCAAMDGALLGSLADRLSRMCAAAPGVEKKMRRKEGDAARPSVRAPSVAPQPQHPTPAPAATAPVADAPDEEDIFAGHGREYAPAPRAVTAQLAQLPRPLPLFPAPPAPPPPPPAAFLRAARAVAADEGYEAYGELFPGAGLASFHGGGGSDEEQGAEGGRGARRRRREAGGERGEGAGAQKLNVQLVGVQRALAEKHGERHAAAFGTGERVGEGGKAPQRAKRLRLG